MAAAMELSDPRHQGRYEVTVYQVGWRLGGKGASGRGPSGRIEEHGLHVWLGFYDNAFMLLRRCYEELHDSRRGSRFPRWNDAFFADAHIGLADRAKGWSVWTAVLPQRPGLPGDPPADGDNPFSLPGYIAQAIELLRRLLLGVTVNVPDQPEAGEPWREETVSETIAALLKGGTLLSAAVVAQGLALLQYLVRSVPASANKLLDLAEAAFAGLRRIFQGYAIADDALRFRWEIADLVQAIIMGTIRDGLLFDPRGLDAINDVDCRAWMRRHGAAEESLNCAFVRALYDLAFAYEDGDPARPGLAAGQALRGCLRMFFSYRGALFWKMRGGMGDVVFAPFYLALERRGVRFEFFHRLVDIRLGAEPDGSHYVDALEFLVQAKTRDRAPYQPLTMVQGVESWPADPDFGQLAGGEKMRREGRDFEAAWDRRGSKKTLRVTRDFDFVVLAVGGGEVANVTGELVKADAKWRRGVENLKTVATQSFQIWMSEDIHALGWSEPPATVSAFVKPFDTWADMSQVIPQENWRVMPRAVAYFCSALPDPEKPWRVDEDYVALRHREVRANAIAFLNNDFRHLVPGSTIDGRGFRWELLRAPEEVDEPGEGEARFDTQFWTANVNPSDRYVLALPGTLEHRISPLYNGIDNLTVAGDWTDCGFNEGCVEAAFISGRLAAHALAGTPPLSEIVGYDHP